MSIPYLLDKVWLFPAIMAGSFLIILFFGKRFSERVTSSIGIIAVLACFVMSLVVAGQWIQRVNHPPTGAESAAAQEACGVKPETAHESEGKGAEGSHGTESKSEGGTKTEGGTNGGTEGETKTTEPSSEHKIIPTTPSPLAGVGEGENAAGLQEGHSETPTTVAEGGTTGGEKAPAAGSEATTEGGGEHAAAEGEHESVVPVCTSVTWFTIGENTFEAGVLLDGLSAMMLFTVTLISLLVHIYSKEYLHEDRRFTHYYAFLSLFTASMLFYVLGTNTLQMLVGWELVGVCSFALIGHWWEEKNNTDAALKAFLTNRVGDVGLILGVIITFFAAGGTSFNVFHINEYALQASAGQKALLFLGVLCLMGGVTSKSGQFPLHTWLPDAMAGPTPVSALIHAATMVVAGVYLIARMYGAFFAGMDIGSGITLGIGESHFFINWVVAAGAITTVVGGTLAFVQHDLKKVLAYSTISQLGYMVLGLGAGAWTGATFHLFTHAMFKACLFLGAGSVSHACHHTFDMREMGGLKKKMPITFWTFMIAGGALAGLPLMSGFWSKDEILSGAVNNGYYPWFALGLNTALMTAMYTTRAIRLTFYGEYRGHAHPHESPKVITIPLMVLATMAVLVALANIPQFGWVPESFALRFEHYVQPTFAFPPEGPAAAGGLPLVPFTPWLAALSFAIACAGIGLMYVIMKNRVNAGATEKNPVLRGGYQLLVNKYYLDRLYTDGIAGSMKGSVARAMYWINNKVIDGVVNAAGVSARAVGGFVYKYLDQGVVDTIVNGSGQASEGGGQYLRRIQSGKVQQYASLLFGSVVVLAICFVLVIK